MKVIKTQYCIFEEVRRHCDDQKDRTTTPSDNMNFIRLHFKELGIFLAIISCVALQVVSAGEQRGQPKLIWIGDARGDIYRASILKQRPSIEEVGDWMVSLNPQRF